MTLYKVTAFLNHILPLSGKYCEINMNIKRWIGFEGERIAAVYLAEIGYEILQFNWRHQHLEVDIVARDGPSLVFVEVKARTSADYGHPEDFVDMNKANLMVRAADQYLSTYDEAVELRFDILSILMDASSISHQLHHFKDAFYNI